MGVEIERKFLVYPERMNPIWGYEQLEQFYLSTDPAVRIRISESTAWLTVKSGKGIRRAEFEYVIPVQDAEEMRPLGIERIVKRRYTIPWEGRAWSVDQFLEPFSDFWLAEVELETEDETVQIPPWVGEEVTGDTRYDNTTLAKLGPPDRTDERCCQDTIAFYTTPYGGRVPVYRCQRDSRHDGLHRRGLLTWDVKTAHCTYAGTGKCPWCRGRMCGRSGD